MNASEISLNSFCDMTTYEMYAVDGGRWTWASTCDLVVTVGCVALGCTGPAGAVLAGCISIGYAIGRGL